MNRRNAIGPGALDRRITVERATGTKNALNTTIKTWGELASFWAARKDVSDAERIGAGQVMASLASRFVIRSSPVAKTVTPIDRIRYDGAIWNIQGIKETGEGRNRFLEITAVRAKP